MTQPFEYARMRKRTAGATLTEPEVRIIKAKLQEGISPRALAGIYQVGIETVRRIDRGETWAWVKLEEGIRTSDLIEEQMAANPPSEELKAKAAASQAAFLAKMQGKIPQVTGEDAEREQRVAERFQQEANRYLKPGKDLDEFIKAAEPSKE